MWSQDLPQYTQYIRISWSYLKMQSPLFLSWTLNLNTYFSYGNGSPPLFSFHHAPKIRVGVIANYRSEKKEWTKDRSWAEVWRRPNRHQTWRGVGSYRTIRSERQGASQVVQWVKNSPALQETLESWIWSLGQKDPLEKGRGNPLQYSCLENPMDRGAWWTIVHRVAKSRTQLSVWAGMHAGDKRSKNRWRKEEQGDGAEPCWISKPGTELPDKVHSLVLTKSRVWEWVLGFQLK